MRELAIAIISVSYGLTCYFLGKSEGIKSIICTEQPKEEIIVKDSLPELTLDNVLEEIIKQDIKHPLIVLKQVIWETGHLKCKDCSLDVNNIFGYGWNGKTYHSYNHWTESIKAYKVWQLKYFKEGDYYQFLEDIGYAKSDKYIENLKSIKL